MEPHRIGHGFRWNALVKYGLLPLVIVGLAVGLTAFLLAVALTRGGQHRHVCRPSIIRW